MSSDTPDPALAQLSLDDKKSIPTSVASREWSEDMQRDFERILTVGEECITASELKGLIISKGRGSNHPTGFILYDGFEPSGRMHIAQGVFKAMNVNKCTKEGTNSTFVFWVADWFALMNDKMGGDLEKIRIVGEYLIEVWKAAGMNLDHVVFKWASDEITKSASTYWPIMLDVARSFNVTRIKKCCQIMGRLEGSLTSAQVLYPLMQCTDVFFLKADICQLGVDQRKVNMLAREYCDAAAIKRKPVILSHHMLYGLKAGQEKMSKSDPDSAVFMEDTELDVERKIMAAYCPSQEQRIQHDIIGELDDAGKESMHLIVDTLKNPCLDYIEHIIFSPPEACFTAGNETYVDFKSVKTAYLSGVITESQLKLGLITALNHLLEPVRQHFAFNEKAKTLLEQVQRFKKETSYPADAKSVRRLNLVSAGVVESHSHIVFAPSPCAAPTLQEAVNTLTLLKLGLGRKILLILPDWTACVCNHCEGDDKIINAYYAVLVSSLKSLDSSLMGGVTILKESDAILMDPSNYWVSVINAGRHFMLDDVMGETLNDSDCVGKVIARLMTIANIMALSPSSIGFLDTGDSKDQQYLIQNYFEEKLVMGLVKPTVLVTSVPRLLLQERLSEAHKTENDEYYLLDDPKVHGKAKMKKAFCEPGNVDFCPPIIFLSIFGPTEIFIRRSTENGGDVKYSDGKVLEKDFKNGLLHPGDLKAVTSAVMFEVLERCADGLREDVEATKASKILKTYAKRIKKS